MATIDGLVNLAYYFLSAFVAFVLIREIIKTNDAQETVLYSIILVPFLLRLFHLK